jgi:hypothetical protein
VTDTDELSKIDFDKDPSAMKVAENIKSALKKVDSIADTE